jgi:hypothetical protein
MNPRRREDDSDDAGVLNRQARPAWRLFVLIGSVLGGGAAAAAAAQSVAKTEAQSVVAPIERKIDDHLAAVVPTRELMQQFVSEQRDQTRMLSRKIDALCRATPQAQCPLGDR